MPARQRLESETSFRSDTSASLDDICQHDTEKSRHFSCSSESCCSVISNSPKCSVTDVVREEAQPDIQNGSAENVIRKAARPYIPRYSQNDYDRKEVKSNTLNGSATEVSVRRNNLVTQDADGRNSLATENSHNRNHSATEVAFIQNNFAKGTPYSRVNSTMLAANSRTGKNLTSDVSIAQNNSTKLSNVQGKKRILTATSSETKTRLSEFQAHRKCRSFSGISHEDETTLSRFVNRRKRCKSESTIEEEEPLCQKKKRNFPHSGCYTRDIAGDVVEDDSSIGKSSKCTWEQATVNETTDTQDLEVFRSVSEGYVFVSNEDLNEKEKDKNDTVIHLEPGIAKFNSKIELQSKQVADIPTSQLDLDEKHDTRKFEIYSHEFDQTASDCAPLVIDGDESNPEKGQGFEEKENGKLCICKYCDYRYSELYARIDELTHDYQWQSQNVGHISLAFARFKGFVRKIAFGLLVFIVCSLCIMSASMVWKTFDGQSPSPEDLAWNFSKSIEELKQDFSSVANMVNEMMTRPRSLIKVTSDDHFSMHGDRFYLKWKEEDHFKQGSLRLSDTMDSVEVLAGGYFVVFCNIFYSTMLNSTSNVKFEYEIVKRKGQTAQHAVMEFTAANGPLRHELMAQTTLYMYPQEEILIRFDRNQENYIASFQGAHVLEIFELS